MPIQLRQFRKAELTSQEAEELDRVLVVARELRDFLVMRQADIDATHVFAAQSSSIQNLVSELLSATGFVEEMVLQPEEGFVTRSRPDFYFELASGRGVIAEVERGGTVNNNHDLKDLWKAHVAANAQHLFLIVPNSNFKQDGSPREKPFSRVVRRLESFFGDPRREIDVVSLHVFGYGKA